MVGGVHAPVVAGLIGVLPDVMPVMVTKDAVNKL